MDGRRFDPRATPDRRYTLAAILTFVWLLVGTGVLPTSGVDVISLAAASVLLAAGIYRQRV